MGQNSSRVQSSSSAASNPPTTQVTPESNDNADLRPEPLPATAEVDSADGSRRASKRRSFLNLVKSSRHRLSSTTSSTSETTRKSWRNSMRWPKPTHDSTPALELSSESTIEGSSSDSGPSLPVIEKGKEPEQPNAGPEAYPEIVPERPSTPFPSTLSESASEPSGHVHETSQNIGSWLSGHSSITDAVSQGGAGEEDEIVIGPQRYDTPAVVEPLYDIPVIHNEPEHNRSAPTPQPEQPLHHAFPTPPPRQFPPPGTLVVVQGIVHTTDVSRTSPPTPAAPPATLPADHDATSINNGVLSGISRRASSVPRTSVPTTTIERSGSRARDRLSALLRSRPSSIVSSQPPSITSPNDNTATHSIYPTFSNTERDLANAELSNSDSESSADTGATGFTTPNVEADSPQEAFDDSSTTHEAASTTWHSGAPAISSNSIDVLGTLLSVAAAATAASLLTGSSEPILSSGLAPPGVPATAPMPTPTPRPMSPTPTTGMGDMSAAGRAERMRQAWTTIRERLGLRPGPADGTSSGGPTDRGARALQDTRELMLQEMARAFNIGLGLGNANPGAPVSEGAIPVEGEEEEPADPLTPSPPPPEGSFERFLVDLQTDLRIALSPEEEDVAASSDDGTVPAEPSTVEQDVTHTNDVEPPPAEPIGESEEAVERGQSEESEPRTQTSASEHAEEAHQVGDDFDGMPLLEDLSDSDDSDEGHEHDNTNFGFPRTTQPTNQHDARSATTAGGTGRIDASGRINWWRLYRFPAITSPRPVGTAEDINTHSPFGLHPSTTSVPPLTPAPPTFPSMPFNDSNSETTPSAHPFSTFNAPHADPSSNNVVIPVIVVGLQSVNANWQADAPAETNDPMGLFGHPHDVPGAEDDMDAFGNQNQQTRGRGAGRGWQSRAANAIRNLRPGRRAASRGAPQFPGSGPGSRTFLIYVIGGYYPPDHSIVTSGPNNFESFEALLELAEILGQVKTPTATKEEIDKSGLEIIKPAQLEQHEKDGKVSLNCTERCLICLDEYATEDDIRVMNCRHAFHRTCVDKWLQTGRNNCPACRTKGVSTAAPPTHMSSAAEA